MVGPAGANDTDMVVVLFHPKRPHQRAPKGYWVAWSQWDHCTYSDACGSKADAVIAAIQLLEARTPRATP